MINLSSLSPPKSKPVQRRRNCFTVEQWNPGIQKWEWVCIAEDLPWHFKIFSMYASRNNEIYRIISGYSGRRIGFLSPNKIIDNREVYRREPNQYDFDMATRRAI